MLTIDLQYASKSDALPSEEDFQRWVAASIEETKLDLPREISIRVVDAPESQQLNNKYRDKNKATNVLSFPCKLPKGVKIPLLGDIVICAPVIDNEALAQGKSRLSHWAHIVVHGVLHLLGYDHIKSQDAERMEKLEIRILNSLGYPDPYK